MSSPRMAAYRLLRTDPREPLSAPHENIPATALPGGPCRPLGVHMRRTQWFASARLGGAVHTRARVCGRRASSGGRSPEHALAALLMENRLPPICKKGYDSEKGANLRSGAGDSR